MELWVRSQDKLMLLKVDAFTISEDSNNKRGFGILDGYTVIGWYKSKERALEVLDDIQNLLQPKIKYIQEEPVESIVDFGYQITQKVDMKIQEINRIVYEMPID